MKALILKWSSRKEHEATIVQLTEVGALGHDFEYLKGLLKQRKGKQKAKDKDVFGKITNSLYQVASWSPDRRYQVGHLEQEEAEESSRQSKRFTIGVCERSMIKQSKKKSRDTAQIEKILLENFPDHPPEFPPEAYRYNPASIRVRVVSPSFRDKNRVERDKMVAPLLKKGLPEDTWQDVTIILLLTPEEIEDSFMNREFEKPTPSRL